MSIRHAGKPWLKKLRARRWSLGSTRSKQLVWNGKDEQDAHDLEVPAVPIYIQETIDPLALVEELAPNLRFLNTLDLAAQRGAEPGSPCTGDGPNISGTGGKSSRFILATVRRAFAAFSPLETVVFP